MARRVSRAVQSDIESKIPVSLYWNIEEVAEWVEELGFPQYVVRKITINFYANLYRTYNYSTSLVFIVDFINVMKMTTTWISDILYIRAQRKGAVV